MELNVTLAPTHDLAQAAQFIARAEALGFDSAWTLDGAHDPFLPLTLAAGRTSRLRLGTLGAAAFPRSPMVVAQIAWDLARQSAGRFSLGLSALPDAAGHSFGEFPGDPVDRTREYVQSLRAIWATFQHDTRLRYRGEYYQFRLMAPFFNPGPIQHPEIPIYLRAGSKEMRALAAECFDGVHLPADASAAYLRDEALPDISRGLRRHGRDANTFKVIADVELATGSTAAALDDAALEARRLTEPYAGLVDGVNLRLSVSNIALLDAIGKAR